MSQRVIDLEQIVSPPIPWGTQGESGATILFLNIQDFLSAAPDGNAVCTFTRQDGHPYIHKFSIEKNNLFITLTQTDTQLIGKCEVQINWLTQGNRVVKSRNFKSFILPASAELPLPLTNESVAALDDLENYVNEAKDLLQKAQYTKQIIFCDELPLEGESQYLYLVSKNNGLYYWKDGWYLLNGTGGLGDYELVLGGDAAGPGTDNTVSGGDA